MPKSTLKIKEHSIVFVGEFSPAKFNPQWLLRKGLIGEAQADAADINVIHKEVSEFSLDAFKLLVLPDRYIISSTQEIYFEAMRDLAINTFECLPACPIFQMGINYHHHYYFEEPNDYIEFGHKIVPKDTLWRSIFPDPRLAKISIQDDHTDGYMGKRVLTVKPSDKEKMAGIEILVNDHYDLYKIHEQDDIDATRAVQTLKERWNASVSNSAETIEGVFEHGNRAN